MTRMFFLTSLLCALLGFQSNLYSRPVIAVLDTGTSVQNVRGVSFTRTSPFVDTCGHGTLMVKVIREENPNAEIIMVKIADNKTEYDADVISRGLEWCLNNNVDVVNLSFTINEDNSVKNSIDRLVSAGITVVAAVGNCALGNGFVVGPDKLVYRAGTRFGGVGFPANMASVISVGALNVWGTRADFARDEGEISADGKWRFEHGTSISTARISGYISLILEKNPGLSQRQIRSIIQYISQKRNDSRYLSAKHVRRALDKNLVAQAVGESYQVAMR
ncbi:MAG: S8 family serine peptidase [Candidatus Auribacterota bacterium]